MAPEWDFLHPFLDDDDDDGLELESELEPVTPPARAPSAPVPAPRGGVYLAPPPPRPAPSIPAPHTTMSTGHLPKVRFEKADRGQTCTIGGCTAQAKMRAVGLAKEIRHCDNGRHNVAANREFFEQVDREGKRADLALPSRY